MKPIIFIVFALILATIPVSAAAKHRKLIYIFDLLNKNDYFYAYTSQLPVMNLEMLVLARDTFSEVIIIRYLVYANIFHLATVAEIETTTPLWMNAEKNANINKIMYLQL